MKVTSWKGRDKDINVKMDLSEIYCEDPKGIELAQCIK